MMRVAAVLVVMLGAAGGARAAEADVTVTRTHGGATDPARNYGNLRLGASSTNENGRPQLCLELSPWQRLSVESCGTGAGLLHDEPRREVMHLHLKWSLLERKTPVGYLAPRVGLGFSELQVGVDRVGFRFTDTDGVETAGPSGSLGLRLAYPVAGGVDLVGDLSVGAAWMRHAPELVAGQSEWLPSMALTVGVGF